MNFFERINQNREDKILRKIRSGNIDERALLKAFRSSNDKINFVAQCNSALQYQLPESLTSAILELAEINTDFLLKICPLMYRK